jgi:hypothetical protein
VYSSAASAAARRSDRIVIDIPTPQQTAITIAEQQGESEIAPRRSIARIVKELGQEHA